VDSLKGFSIGSTDLAKKFKDVRRRTTQKVAELIGVAEATHQNSALGAAYREYVWLGSYLDKFKVSVVNANASMHKTVQATFQLATQLQAELTPEADEQVRVGSNVDLGLFFSSRYFFFFPFFYLFRLLFFCLFGRFQIIYIFFFF
jgi:hypothetical protein